MKFKSFQEYLDTNKNLVTKPKVKKVADYEGKPVSKPGKEDKHKDAGGKGPVGEPQPYVGGTAAKDRNSDDPKGLGHVGDKKMVYEPDVDAALKDVKTWPKVNVADWVDNNKNLSLAEFTKKIRGENQGTKIYESAKIVAKECKENSKNIVSFVREIKRNNLLEAFLCEMLKNEEAFNVLGQLITQNEFYANKLDLVISEMVAAPIGLDGGDSGDEMDSSNLSKRMGSEDMDDEEDSEDMDDEDMGDEEDSEDMDDEDMDDEDMDDEDMDDEDMGDEEDSDEEGEENHRHRHHHHHGDEDMGDEDMGDEGEDMARTPNPNPFMPRG